MISEESIGNSSISFADVAFGELRFDQTQPADRIVLELIDTKWVQRLRSISQTGNTKAVYMFAEHSRFGHSLGVAYLVLSLMKSLKRFNPESVNKHELAVAAAGILHDIGHTAPGSHLAERVWTTTKPLKHEILSCRVIEDDCEIGAILERYEPGLTKKVIQILKEDPSLPNWCISSISGSGWNADRGNWTIVDSSMCAVSYGRYNVSALVDSFRITADGRLALLENRLDALTHFYVARDSMYRQVYQHRVLQVADQMTVYLIRRARELLKSGKTFFMDEAMRTALEIADPTKLPIGSVFEMTEEWFRYHLTNWCKAEDPILQDLAQRLRDRKLLKTIRLLPPHGEVLEERARDESAKQGLNSDYYVFKISESDTHRTKKEVSPLVKRDNGEIIEAHRIEPTIQAILTSPTDKKVWLAVTKEIKKSLQRN